MEEGDDGSTPVRYLGESNLEKVMGKRVKMHTVAIVMI